MRASILVLAAASLLGFACAAQSVTYTLPQDATPAELSKPDATLVVANCSGCHSLDYITTQPRGKGPQYWRDAVKKMVDVYKAPVSASDAEAVSAILAKKFG